MQGIDLAKRKDIKFGRRHVLNDDQREQLRIKRLAGVKIADLMTEYKISKASVYRALA